MKIAFFGSPELAVPIVKALNESFDISLIITQPDKKVGRKQILTPTPIKQFALEHTIPVETPPTLKSFTSANMDIAIVVAYGLLIPKEVLSQPKYGFINIHYSLLPKYRGASPVQSAIINGDEKTGVTIMKIDEQLDHGDIIAQKEIGIDLDDSSESLLSKLNSASIPLLLSVLETIDKTNALPETTKQDHSKATFTKKVAKQDGFIPFEEVRNSLQIPSEQSTKIHNKIRGFYPWPGVWTMLPNEKRLKLISSRIVSHPERREGSTEIDSSASPQNDKLELLEIQLEGKRATKDLKLISQLFI